MIEFIIYDESNETLIKTKNIIESTLMNYDYEYKIITYSALHEMKNQEMSKNYKVYILDIKSRIKSGAEYAKYVREKLLDWQSMIIFTFINSKDCYKTFTERLMILDYIQKDNNYEKSLSEAVTLALRNYDARPKTLKYSYKNTWYNIAFSSILYIEKEQDSKRCLIKTLNETYYTLGNLRQIEQKLDKRFIKCNRSYIINLEQVLSYNTKDNIITFSNQDTLNIISRTKRKEIIERLRFI